MKIWIRIFFIAAVLGLAAYIVTSIDLGEAYDSLSQADGLYLFLAFASYFITFFIFSIRNFYFFRWLLKPDYMFLIETVFAGFFLNTVLPSAQIGGDPPKAYAFGLKYNKPVSKTFGVIFADKIIHILSLLLFIFFSVIYLVTFMPLPREFEVVLQAFLFFIFIVSIIIPIFSMRKTKTSLYLVLKKSRMISWLNPFKKNSKLQERIGKHIGDFTRAFKRTLRTKKILFLGIVLSIIYWILNYFVSYFLFLSLGIKINFLLVIVVFSLVSFAGVFFPTPGGVGLIESLMIFLYSLAGVDLETAIIVSLLTRVIFYFYAIVIGGISLIHLENTLKS
ncbi:MAG: lysylphosphatidylglycerol synthase transmembrane domain-containing protein [Nanoarchaeota archaeon]